ncbi:MAG TPA: serine/threonine-protein kinase [Polyangiaceae bacterium]|jgi:serine/threonine-protein kinase|nr:serine/threonine-protein kinase [Polyangiaceae bacterium]
MMLTAEAIRRIQQRVGTTVRAKYRLERLLGIGGTAAVFEATHRNGSHVALKVLHPELARLSDVRGRFLREGYVANRIGHPGVARVIDDDDDDVESTVFLVLELLEGETLQARRERVGGRLAVTETLDHVDRLLEVLAAAHEQGIVHRDLKPDNLFLTARGELKVLDFGIARLLEGTTATRSGQVLGTPAFMSPEQANGRIREIDGRTDLWSVGAVLFTLLTGAVVHEARTPTEQMVYAATQQARRIELRAPWIAPEVAKLVNRALAFDRDSRWPSAREMRSALRATESFRNVPSPSAPPARAHTADPALAQTIDVSAAAAHAAFPQRESPAPGAASTIAFDLQRRPGPRDRGQK